MVLSSGVVTLVSIALVRVSVKVSNVSWCVNKSQRADAQKVLHN